MLYKLTQPLVTRELGGLRGWPMAGHCREWFSWRYRQPWPLQTQNIPLHPAFFSLKSPTCPSSSGYSLAHCTCSCARNKRFCKHSLNCISFLCIHVDLPPLTMSFMGSESLMYYCPSFKVLYGAWHWVDTKKNLLNEWIPRTYYSQNKASQTFTSPHF